MTKQVKEILKEKGRKEAYLLNNRLWWGNFISGEQYNVNHLLISKSK